MMVAMDMGVVVTHLVLEVDIEVQVMQFLLQVMIASSVAVLDIGLVNALMQMEVDLEGTLPLPGMALPPVDVVTALADQTVLLTAMLMIVMTVAAMLMIVIVVGVIAILQLQIVFLVTDMLVQIVMHQVALPGKGAMKEMEDVQVEVITVMNLEQLVVMEGVARGWLMVTDMGVVDLLALVGVTEIDLLPMIVPAGEQLALMMTATDGGYLGSDQRFNLSLSSQFLLHLPLLCWCFDS